MYVKYVNFVNIKYLNICEYVNMKFIENMKFGTYGTFVTPGDALDCRRVGTRRI